MVTAANCWSVRPWSPRLCGAGRLVSAQPRLGQPLARLDGELAGVLVQLAELASFLARLLQVVADDGVRVGSGPSGMLLVAARVSLVQL